MKTLFLSFLLLLSTTLPAQTHTERYIELHGWQMEHRDIRIVSAIYPVGADGQPDSLVNARKINQLVNAAYQNKTKPIQVLNELAKEGWVLVSTVFLPSENSSITGTMYYFLKKSFQSEMESLFSEGCA